MAGFNRLLLAIDLSPTSRVLIQRVIHMYGDELEKVHVVHVIKPILNFDLAEGMPDSRDPDTQREHHATRRRVIQLLHETGLGCAVERFHLAYGEPSFQIKRLARELNADLVIVGSHTREDDWLHLPGATTNCVIQGISSDVMAVKV